VKAQFFGYPKKQKVLSDRPLKPCSRKR